MFTACCQKGKVRLPDIRVPDFLEQLLTRNDNDTPENKRIKTNYIDNILCYNSSLAFASRSATNVPTPPHGHFVMRIHGQVYHTMGTLEPQFETTRKYAQLYMVDSEMATLDRLRASDGNNLYNRNCIPELMTRLDAMIREINPFAIEFRNLNEVLAEMEQDGNQITPDVRLYLTYRNSVDRYNYQLPAVAVAEIAAVFIGDEEGRPPGDIHMRIYPRGHHYNQISNINPMRDPMTFVLLFPYGDPGFELNIPHIRPTGTGNRIRNVTHLEFYAYRIARREGFSIITQKP